MKSEETQKFNDVESNPTSMYVYSWSEDKSVMTERRDGKYKIRTARKTLMRAYGLTADGKTICLKVRCFAPSVVVELPSSRAEDPAFRKKVIKHISDWTSKWGKCETNKPVRTEFFWTTKLYGAHVDPETCERKVFPFMRFYFRNKCAFRGIGKYMNTEIENEKRISVCESDASPLLQLVTEKNIPTVGWVGFSPTEKQSEKESRCDFELDINFASLTRLDNHVVPKPLVMAFDIECNSSSDVFAFPDPKRPGDVIFQISCVFSTGREVLLTLGDPDPKIVSREQPVEIRRFHQESRLISGFSELVNETMPQIITGYNIFKFDFPYLLDRFKWELIGKFGYRGSAEETKIHWSSSGMGNQDMRFVNPEGIVVVDLYPIVQHDYQLADYRLDTVAFHFLKEKKEDLDAIGIFRCFREGMKTNPDGTFTDKAKQEMGICGSYCMKDSRLCIRILKHLETWLSISAIADVCRIPMTEVFTRGQGIRVFSMVYSHCRSKEIVISEPPRECVRDSTDKLSGGHVFENPKDSMEDYGRMDKNVATLDFASLYPNTIKAENFDPTSWISQSMWDQFPEHMVNVYDWEDHVGCEHDPKKIEADRVKAKIAELRASRSACIKRFSKTKGTLKHLAKVSALKKIDNEINLLKDAQTNINTNVNCNRFVYKFLKKEFSGEGVFPSIITTLLAQRKAIKKRMKTEPDPEKKKVLDKKQLAVKISTNSLYGDMGAQFSKCPFLPGSRCTTSTGRRMIKTVARVATSDYSNIVQSGGDSVTEDTPILCKSTTTGKIEIKKTKDLVPDENSWFAINEFKESSTTSENGIILRHSKQQTVLPEYLVWTSKGFQPVKRLIRHKTNKRIFRVQTRHGFVDVTEDHSCLDEEKNLIKPQNIKKNERLLHNFPEALYSTDSVIGKMERRTFCVVSDLLFPHKLTLKPHKKTEAAKLAFLFRKIGLFVDMSTNDKRIKIKISHNNNEHKTECTNVKQMRKLPEWNLVYDIETETGDFGCGFPLIVKNTDSVHVKCVDPTMDLPAQCALFDKIAEEITKKHFSYGGGCHLLEFEEVKHAYIFLAKKKYLTKVMHDKNASEEDLQRQPVKSKGTILTRRDNSNVVRDIYRESVDMTMKEVPREQIHMNIIEYLNGLFSDRFDSDISKFVVTKSMKEIGSVEPKRSLNETSGKVDWKIGDYKIREKDILPKDKDKRAEFLRKEGFHDEEDWYMNLLPAIVLLSYKMKKRGQFEDNGLRAGFLVIDSPGSKKLKDKVENAGYFEKHKDVLTIDHEYYADQLQQPMDQLLNTVFPSDVYFVKDQIALRKQKRKVMDEIKSYSAPRFILEE